MLIRLPVLPITVAIVIGFSVYVGLEIDYRHWTWIVFLVVIPAAGAIALALRARSATEARKHVTQGKRRKRKGTAV
jgi:hypothetical protein